MPRPRKLTAEAIERLREIQRLRDALPSDKELAREYGVCVRTVEKVMIENRKYERAVAARQCQ